MAGERRLNWGADATDAQYRTGDDDANNRFIVAEDLNGGTVLLEYDEGNSQWVSRGAVDLNGNDLSGVGALTATSISTKQQTTGGKKEEQLIFDDSISGTFSKTFTFNKSEINARYIILVHEFAVSTGGPTVTLDIPGIADGDYDYVTVDETGTVASQTGENQFNLIELGSDNDQIAAGFVLSAAEGRAVVGECEILGGGGSWTVLKYSNTTRTPNSGDLTATLSGTEPSGTLEQASVEVRKITHSSV